MKKVVCMMVVGLLATSVTATMAQQDTTRRGRGQTTSTDTSRTPKKAPGEVKRDTTRRK